MASKEKSIALVFDPSKKLGKIAFMNAIAGVCQILHTDPLVGSVEIQIAKHGKVIKKYPIKLE